MASLRLPLWLRFVLLVGVVALASGASLLAYRYYTRPVTLSVAVGSIDGEAAKVMSAIASEFVSTNAPVRLKVVDSGTALEAANAFAAGKVDLAVVRGDVGDLSQAQAVVVVSHMVVLIVAPPGSTIDGMDKLKGRRVGVIGGDDQRQDCRCPEQDLRARSRQDIQEYRLAGRPESDPVQRGCGAARCDPAGRKISVAACEASSSRVQRHCRC